MKIGGREKKTLFDQLEFDYLESAMEHIPVYFKTWPMANDWIEVRVLVNVGPWADPADKRGLTFLTKSIICDTLQPMFREGNFSSGFESLVFSTKIVKQGLLKAPDDLRAVIFFPAIPVAKFMSHKHHLMETFRQNENVSQLKDSFSELYQNEKHQFLLHPHGNLSGISRISYEDVCLMHHNYFHKKNIAVVLVGHIDEYEADEFADALAIGINSDGLVKPVTERKYKDAGFTNNPIIFSHNAEYSWINWIRLIPFGDRVESIKLLATLLRDVVGEKFTRDYATTHGVTFSLLDYYDHHHLAMECNVEALDYPKCKSFLEDLFCEIALGGMYRDRFNKIKQETISDLEMEEYEASEVADHAMSQIPIFGSVHGITKILENLRSVTYEEIQLLAKKNLTPDKVFWRIAHPFKS